MARSDHGRGVRARGDDRRRGGSCARQGVLRRARAGRRRRHRSLQDGRAHATARTRAIGSARLVSHRGPNRPVGARCGGRAPCPAVQPVARDSVLHVRRHPGRQASHLARPAQGRPGASAQGAAAAARHRRAGRPDRRRGRSCDRRAAPSRDRRGSPQGPGRALAFSATGERARIRRRELPVPVVDLRGQGGRRLLHAARAAAVRRTRSRDHIACCSSAIRSTSTARRDSSTPRRSSIVTFVPTRSCTACPPCATCSGVYPHS